MYKTINGIDNLNLILQSVFNPKDSRKNEIIINGITFREDDKVIELFQHARRKHFQWRYRIYCID